MVVIASAGSALLWAGIAALSLPAPPPKTALEGAAIRQRSVVRVPVGAAAPPVRWRERDGNRCLVAERIAAAAITPDGAVDFVMRGGRRIRARLESACPALDFYHGFYVRPDRDGRVCAERDAIHARSGGECEIERLRRLDPIPPRR